MLCRDGVVNILAGLLQGLCIDGLEGAVRVHGEAGLGRCEATQAARAAHHAAGRQAGRRLRERLRLQRRRRTRPLRSTILRSTLGSLTTLSEAPFRATHTTLEQPSPKHHSAPYTHLQRPSLTQHSAPYTKLLKSPL